MTKKGSYNIKTDLIHTNNFASVLMCNNNKVAILSQQTKISNL